MRNDMESWCYWACDVMCLCMGIGYTQYRYRFTLESSACALVCMCIVHVRRCFDTAFFLQLSTLIDIITKTTIYSSSKLFLFLPFLFTYTCNALLGFCCKKTDWLYTSLFGIFSFENEYSFFPIYLDIFWASIDFVLLLPCTVVQCWSFLRRLPIAMYILNAPNSKLSYESNGESVPAKIREKTRCTIWTGHEKLCIYIPFIGGRSKGGKSMHFLSFYLLHNRQCLLDTDIANSK